MKRLVALGVSLILSAELAALVLHDRRFVLWAAGAAALFALVNVRQVLGHGPESPPAPPPNALEETLRSWLTRTETLIRRSESTRTDWDRHLRPCWPDGSHSRRAKTRPNTRQRLMPPGKCFSGRNCGRGWIPTMSRRPVRANPDRAERRSRKFWKGWRRYDDAG